MDISIKRPLCQIPIEDGHNEKNFKQITSSAVKHDFGALTETTTANLSRQTFNETITFLRRTLFKVPTEDFY